MTDTRTEIIQNGLRLLDNGKIPVIKGPPIDYMYVVDEESYKDENVIFEGRYGNWIWMILHGIVEIIKETPAGPISILRLGEGAFIGNLAAFLPQQQVERTASVRAIGKLQLAVLDSQRLAKEFAQSSPDFRGLILSLNHRLIQATNRVVELALNKPGDFPLCPKQIIKQAESVVEPLFRITAGRALVSRSIDQKNNLPLVCLEKDDYFGNVSFLNTGLEPCGASVFASEDFQAAPVDTQLIEQEFARLSTTFQNMLKVTASSISITSQVAYDFFNRIQGKTKIK